VTPLVTDSAAGSDRAWFTKNPHRRYRLRNTDGTSWLIRRRAGGVLLRTAVTPHPRRIPDIDSALREAWFAAAMPYLSPIERAALVKQVRKSER
jgi:hypothetical protein